MESIFSRSRNRTRSAAGTVIPDLSRKVANRLSQSLAASRAKSGQDQLARLGAYLGALDSQRAYYVNFTEAAWVRSAHAYFEGMALKNKAIEKFFNEALNGRPAETELNHQTAGNYYDFG